jgi:pimeloyl-ACP methyl ester carboxylesterase
MKQWILIIHGWGRGAERWQKTAEKLSEAGFSVLLPDLPGFGQAPPPSEPWGVSEYADFLATLLTAKGVKKTVVIGHSFGGQLAVALAFSHPELVEKIILVSPAIIRTRSLKSRGCALLAKLTKPVLQTILSAESFKQWQQLAYRLLASPDYFQAKGVMKETLKKVIAADLSSKLNSLSCPLLIIWGDKDRQISLRQLGRLKSLKPEMEIKVFPGVGHDLPFSQREGLVQTIKTWVQS